jgi:hypothetical protein
MVEGLIFLAAFILFIDYMNKFYVSKDVDDPNTKRFLQEIEADKRREKFYGKKRNSKD